MSYSESTSLLFALVCLSLTGCLPELESVSGGAKPHASAHSKGHEEAHGGKGHGETKEHGETKGHGEAEHGEGEGHNHQIVVTTPVRKGVVTTQPYVCQIHSCKRIEVRALNRGYLEAIHVNEGQAVSKGDLLFKIMPIVYQAKLDTDIAEAERIRIERFNAKSLNAKGIVSPQEVALKDAELAKAEAKVSLARAELSFTSITAPFNGIVDRQHSQLGSLIEEGEVLTTLSDNSLMWVYFNVPEARYIEYKRELDAGGNQAEHLHIELKLANGEILPQEGKIGAIEAEFNNTTGNIAFRADFSNPKGLLRNGQTGTILIHRNVQGVVVIPQRATFEILDKRYVFVVDEKNVVHQRDITVSSEQDDIFVIEKGLSEKDRIVFEGIRQVRDGETIEYKFAAPTEVLASLKHPAQ